MDKELIEAVEGAIIKVTYPGVGYDIKPTMGKVDRQLIKSQAQAAITAHLKHLEENGMVVRPRIPTRATIDAAVSYGLNVKLSGEYPWSDYMGDLYKTMINASQPTE